MAKVKRSGTRFRYNPLLRNGNSKKINGTTNKIDESNEVPENLVVGKGRKGLKNVCQKLNLESSDEKVVALNILAAFSLDKGNAATMVEEKVSTQVSPLMLHPDSNVQLAATGVLCNLCGSIPDALVDSLLSQDVLVNVCNLLKNFQHIISPPPDEKNAKFAKGIAMPQDDSDQMSLILIYAFNILSRLCEASEEVVAFVSCEGILTIMMKFIHPDPWGYALAISASECLLCITEDNPTVMSIVASQAETYVSLITKNQSSYKGLHFCAIIAGILVNLHYSAPEGSAFQKIFEVLSSVLDIDLKSVFNACTVTGTKLDEFHSSLSAQLLSLEVLSNWCYSDDETEPSDSDSEDEMDVDVNQSDCVPETLLPKEAIEAITRYELAVKTLKIVTQLTEDFIDVKRLLEIDIDEVQSRIKLLKTRSLQCLQNLVSFLNSRHFGGTDTLYTAWQLLLSKMPVILENHNEDPLYLEAASSALRAIIFKLCEEKSSCLNSIGEEQLKVMLQISNQTISSVKVNLSRMLGTLGCYLISCNTEQQLMENPSKEVLITITRFMLETAQKATDLWVIAEAFDVLIDLYAEDNTDHIAKELKLVESLQSIQPRFNNKYKKHKKKLRDHRAVVSTVKDNLSSFIQYKQERLQSI